MSLLHKPGETIPFSPADQDSRPAGKRIVYHLRVPSAYDKVALRRALAEHNAQQHGPLALLGALRRGVEQIMADSPAEPREFMLAAIDEQIARQTEFNTAILGNRYDTETEEGRAAFVAAFQGLGEGAEALREAEGLVARGYAPYRAMLGDNGTYWAIAGIESARLFLDGCDGMEGFARDRGGATEAFLARVPDDHLVAIARRVQELLNPSEADVKNSDSPSGSRSEAAISKVSKTPPRKPRSKTITGT